MVWNELLIKGKLFLFSLILVLSSLSALSQKVLTLEDAMNIALKNSPDIIRSELNMTISQENLKAWEASTKSRFALEVTPFNYNQSRMYDDFNAVWNTSETKSSSGDFIISQPIVRTDGTLSLHNVFGYQDKFTEYNNKNTKDYYNNFYVGLSQPIFTYNRQKMQRDRLKLALEDATLSYSVQRLALEKQVTQYFYMVYQTKMSLQIAEDEYKNQKSSYEIIKSKVEGGLSANAELVQAELNYSNSESAFKNKQVELANAKDDFKAYIGLPLTEEFEIQANMDFSVVEIDLGKAVSNGLATRMELRKQEISLQNSQFDLTVAQANNEFKGVVDLSIGLTGESPELANVYDTPTRTPQAGIKFSIPIWDWGESKARVKMSEATIKIEEINIESQKTMIELSIMKSFRSLQNLAMQIDIAKQSEKNAQLTYDINLERYKNGDLTSMDLGRYQNQLSTAKMNLANSLISYKLELLNMKIQSLWDFENNINFVPKTLQENLKK